MTCYDAMEEANAAGRLGLILYTIPNFPNPIEYQQTIDLMDGLDAVTIVETTDPVGEGFSEHANATIREAHRIAHASPTDSLFAKRIHAKPVLCVLYKGSLKQLSFDGWLSRVGDKIDAMILEWAEDNEGPYVTAARKHGIEVVQCIGPWMSQKKIETNLSLAAPNALVYLMSAEMTGAKLFDNQALESCISKAKAFKGDIKIAAGFGIENASQIRLLRQVKGLDGVIIGTAFLKEMRNGIAAVRAYLDSIIPALSSGPNVKQ